MIKHTSKKIKGADQKKEEVEWHFTLYIIPNTESSNQAMANLKAIMDASDVEQVTIEYTDISLPESMASIKENDVYSAPTLIRTNPKPIIKIVGDLQDHKNTAITLGVEHQPLNSPSEFSTNMVLESYTQIINTYLLLEKGKIPESLKRSLLTKMRSLQNSDSSLTDGEHQALKGMIDNIKSELLMSDDKSSDPLKRIPHH